jgi:shikimate kinase
MSADPVSTEPENPAVPGPASALPEHGKSPAVVLVGPPGAGKSSVGRLLASRLGVPFADTDELVARAAGKPVGDVFVEDGEQVFREFERGAVARGLEETGRHGGVLALGSGAVLDVEVRQMISRRTVVYLEAAFATVAKRSGMDRPRVVIPGNPRGRLRAMLEERQPVYSDLASLTVSTDGMAPEEVVADLASRLSS